MVVGGSSLASRDRSYVMQTRRSLDGPNYQVLRYVLPTSSPSDAPSLPALQRGRQREIGGIGSHRQASRSAGVRRAPRHTSVVMNARTSNGRTENSRSEEHTSELQSLM